MRRAPEAWRSRKRTTGSACRDLVFPDGDIAGPNSNTAFDPSLEYSTNRVMLFWQLPPSFSPQPILSFVVEDVSYARAEKCMMGEKANFCQDHLEVELIMTLPDPSTYKRIGRAVRNFDSAAGDSEKKDAVLSGTYGKCTPNPSMKNRLLSSEKIFWLKPALWTQCGEFVSGRMILGPTTHARGVKKNAQ